MFLQNCTNSEAFSVGLYSGTYPASHDANENMTIKAEEVSDTQEEMDSLGITVQKIEAEPEVSSVFLYVHCLADMQKCELSFSSPSVSLSVHTKQQHCAADWTVKTVIVC
jgi:hypothetical protein